MTSIIEKRRSLHRYVEIQRRQNETLKMQLGQLQALANIGTTTCMIAHEINNLLTPLLMRASLALSNPDDKVLTKKALEKTEANCRRGSKMMESILNIATGEAGEKQENKLTDLLEEAFSSLCRDFSKDGITVKIEVSEGMTVWAVPVEIQQVLMNLILNARDAMLGHGGVLTVRAEDDTDAVHIMVSDTGCGIKPEDLKKIFEPFFTTKTPGSLSQEAHGTGLGLAFCEKVIDSHNGDITVESQPSKGTIFTVTLPKAK